MKFAYAPTPPVTFQQKIGPVTLDPPASFNITACKKVYLHGGLYYYALQ